MPKKSKELMPLQVKRLTKDGLHAVGGVTGLYLQVWGGSRSWILRTTVGTKRREMGLGGFPDVSLSAAREAARAARASIKEGIDPVAVRRAARMALCAPAVPSFDEAARQFIASRAAEWRNAKHGDQWRNTLGTYASPVMGKLPVSEIDTRHVLAVLEPIWHEKTETAVRLRGRIESILDWAKVAGHRDGDNPARWKGQLEHLLAKPGKVAKKENYPALPIDAMPAFMAALRKRDGASRVLEFLILTATRSSEARGARWCEFDLAAKTWTIPAARMKADRDHVVALSESAVALVRAQPVRAGTDLVFPAARGGTLSDMTLSKVVKLMHKADIDRGGAGYIDPKLQRVAVPHGFRSTFKDWAAERTDYPNMVSEAALAHIIADKTEGAYRRGNLLEKRAALMADWAAFIGAQPADNVTPIRRRA